MGSSPQSASTAATPTSLHPPIEPNRLHKLNHAALHSASAGLPSASSPATPLSATHHPSSTSTSTSASTATATRSTAELTRAEAIGLYRSGNLASLPRPASPSQSRDNQSVSSSRASSNTATRRPRAGTMPSSFNSISGSSPLSLVNAPPSARPEILRQLNLLAGSNALQASASNHLALAAGLHGSVSMPDSGHNTPHGSDLNLRLSLEKTRARAGTVALPPSSASSYFGRGVFSTNFVPRTTRMNEELRSIRSDESALGDAELQTEAGHVRTLDYLGLDADSPVSPTVPNPPQSAFAGTGFYHVFNNYPHPVNVSGASNQSLSVLANRMRASTVSGMAPSLAALRGPSVMQRPSPFHSDESLYNQSHSGANSPAHLDDDYSVPLGSANSLVSQYATGRVGRLIRSADPMQQEAHDKTLSAYPHFMVPNTSNGLLAPHRPRANTLGGASLFAGAGAPSTSGGLSAASAAASVRNRAGTLAGLSKHTGYLNSIGSESSDGGGNANLNPLGYVTVENMHHWMSGSRPMTPEVAMGAMMPQPSRSLWIGKLDASTTAQELMSVFAVYGAIESLRLLPERECGFINFVSVHDAAHARDDVVNRLEGQINLKNGPTKVKIGFGKPESAPQTPASLLTNQNGGLAQTMMMLSLSNLQGPNGLMATSQINNINPSPTGYTNVGGIILGPNGDPVLQSSPTRALWVGSIPSQTTPNHLMDIFSPFGAVESARVLTHKNCGFINFEHLDDAVRARKALNGREILGSEVGAVKIGYAKVPVKAPGTYSPTAQLEGLGQDPIATQQLAYETLARMRGASTVPLDQQIMSGSIQDYRSNLAMSFLPNGIHALSGFPLASNLSSVGGFPQSALSNHPSEKGGAGEVEGASAVCSAPMPPVSEMQLLMKELCRSNGSQEESEESSVGDEEAVAEFRPPVTYYTTVPPPINQLDPHRRLVSAASDPARLREIRKRIDSNVVGQEEMDQVANELLEEIVYLSSDYIGNTIVQKFFEKCSLPVKLLMLERCAPHLAIIGCHKNGTWAAQKMIDCASTEEEMKIICQNLRPFGPPLLLDSLGNYVMQCCLRFGAPLNEFVFDSIVDRCWEVAQGRFGARSVRTCLESKYTTRFQIKRVAIAVIMNSIPLATNPNGTLLLTWLLDTSGLPGRYRLLAPRLAPHLSHLCTHKLALVTVLRIVNQSIDPQASQMIIDGLFHSAKQVLEEVLGDQVHGVNVLSKMLASTFVGAEQKAMMSGKIKEAMLALRVQHIPAYKKLADEVGVPTTGVAGASAQLLGSASAQGTPTRSQSTGAGKTWTASGGGSGDGLWTTGAGVGAGTGGSPFDARFLGGIAMAGNGRASSNPGPGRGVSGRGAGGGEGPFGRSGTAGSGLKAQQQQAQVDEQLVSSHLNASQQQHQQHGAGQQQPGFVGTTFLMNNLPPSTSQQQQIRFQP